MGKHNFLIFAVSETANARARRFALQGCLNEGHYVTSCGLCAMAPKDIVRYPNLLVSFAPDNTCVAYIRFLNQNPDLTRPLHDRDCANSYEAVHIPGRTAPVKGKLSNVSPAKALGF